MENKEAYEKSTVAFVEVPIRDLEKCKEIAEYFHMTAEYFPMTPDEALHYSLRKGIELVWEASKWPEVRDD